MSKLLVVMRLADMHKGHPAQDNTRFCSICSERVGVYPSGQKALKHNPDMKIVCHVCIEAAHDPAALSVAAAPFEEILEETRQSAPVKRQ